MDQYLWSKRLTMFSGILWGLPASEVSLLFCYLSSKFLNNILKISLVYLPFLLLLQKHAKTAAKSEQWIGIKLNLFFPDMANYIWFQNKDFTPFQMKIVFVVYRCKEDTVFAIIFGRSERWDFLLSQER